MCLCLEGGTGIAMEHFDGRHTSQMLEYIWLERATFYD